MIYRDGKKVKTESDDDSDSEDDSTTLVPKSIVPGEAKVGDKIMLEIVHAFDDEYEVAYSHKRKDDKYEDSSSSPDMDRANSDLDALASPAEA